MIVVLLLSAILVFHDLPSVHSLGENESCLSPNNEMVLCKKLSSCAVILTELQKQSAEAIRFARESQCGYTSEPLVCCGSSGLFTSNTVFQHRLLPAPNKCGIEHSSPKIHNGEEAELREFPWIAALGYILNGENEITFSCGGSLINNRYVLTAAHCIKRRDRTLTMVRLGEHNSATNIDCAGIKKYQVCNPPAEDFDVENTVVHQSYKNKNKVHDIALIRLKRTVEFKVHIQPVCLPADSGSRAMAGLTVTVAGWGETEKGTNSAVKLKAKLSVIPQPACVNRFIDNVNITDMQYCATGLCENNKKCADTCKGDSGGPSVRAIKHPTQLQWIQEGITSFGVQICGQGYPAVYTQVSKYLRWIVDNMRD